jgi:Putative 2OG-Fe(II) oxygenase
MKAPLFEYPSYQYQIDDWSFKKKGLLNRINSQKFVRTTLQTFETDRSTNKKSYLHYFQDLIKPQLFEFCQEAQVTCSMTDCWAVRYKQGDQQTVHTHRGWGFSGVVYVEYDPKHHTPTCFVAPWQDPRTDTTTLAYPQNVKEGTLVIVPSYTLHFVHPNQSRKQRTIISFDLLPKLPEHQSINT